MKVKKFDIYKMELKIILPVAIAIVLTIITGGLIGSIRNIIKKILELYNINLHLSSIRYILSPIIDVFGSESVEFFLLLIIYFHLIFRKKVISFLELDRAVKAMANGDFKTRIQNNSEDDLGKLSQNINKVMDKFNLVLEEQKEAEQTKINLITSISHDLRTPLTSILGYLKLADNDEYDDEFTLRSYVNIALNKTKRLKVLIDDLFELTTLNNYGIKISKDKVNIAELIKQLAVEHRINFANANIECRLNILDEKFYVLGDVNKLVRAFENLIFNCIKYSKSSKFMDISLNKIDSKAILEFTNYGDPIPPMDIPYIFQRFYRVDKSRSSETGGSGLGLAIAKNIVELHDGRISVESNACKTTFKIELPCFS
ncbi:sensor histidine kinase [Clostridium hydrogenum]|uniref:sensor histidine kinase n=1 Tax=Clostridium hydrogenum TaxID=2855764 RepID=UPI001F1A537A|nr:HAMP domain-containing sensor histidine kinase [Clostridium hydrogenum]